MTDNSSVARERLLRRAEASTYLAMVGMRGRPAFYPFYSLHADWVQNPS